MRRTICLVLLLVLGLLFTPSPSAQTTKQSDQTDRQGDTRTGSKTGSQTDRSTDDQTGAQTGKKKGTEMGTKASQMSMTPTQFLKHAMMSNMAEIQLGQLAAERASSSQVKQFAQHMVDSHTKANEQVKKVAQQKGVQPPTDLDAKHRKTVDQLSALQGAAFDRAYMEHMVKDHREAVDAFTAQAKNSSDQDVRRLATTMTPELQQHLQSATETRRQVTGGTPGRAE